MTHTTEDIALDHGFPGTRRSLTIHRFGPTSPASAPVPKAYIQAALHADEIPGLLVAQHLLARLAQADTQGLIRGDIVLVPYANPIGLSQAVLGTAIGRFALSSGVNFNRDFPDLTAQVADQVMSHLGADATTNVALVRRAAVAAAAALETATEADSLRKALLGLAIDADYVLDLHCDSEALLHAYTGTESWPEAQDLMADLGCRAVFLALESGGSPFDEACSGLWWRLRNRLTADGKQAPPLPAACLAATIELRGRQDVDDGLAATDADALMRFLVRRGLVAGDALPPPLPAGTATPWPAWTGCGHRLPASSFTGRRWATPSASARRWRRWWIPSPASATRRAPAPPVSSGPGRNSATPPPAPSSPASPARSRWPMRAAAC